MFTGLVERTGKVVSITGAAASAGLPSQITQLIVDGGKDFATEHGDSVAINGCCLTVTANRVQLLAFDISSETLARTTLGRLREGDEVNLERALKLGDRLGGHLVSGHIDGVGTVERLAKRPDGWGLDIVLPAALGCYCITKGSITVDGVSLTINGVEDLNAGTRVNLMLIPTTVSLTALKTLSEGTAVNIEVDAIGKYIERLHQPHRPR